MRRQDQQGGQSVKQNKQIMSQRGCNRHDGQHENGKISLQWLPASRLKSEPPKRLPPPPLRLPPPKDGARAPMPCSHPGTSWLVSCTNHNLPVTTTLLMITSKSDKELLSWVQRLCQQVLHCTMRMLTCAHSARDEHSHT